MAAVVDGTRIINKTRVMGSLPEKYADMAFKRNMIENSFLSKETEVTFYGKDPYVTRLVPSNVKIQEEAKKAGKSQEKKTTWDDTSGGRRAWNDASAGAEWASQATKAQLGSKAAWDYEDDMRLMSFRTPSQRMEEHAVGWSRGESLPLPEVKACNQCPKGHKLERFTAFQGGYTCEECGPYPLPKNSVLYGCRRCDYDLCSVHGCAGC
mmetsp:Transcript_3500/g.6328  ORF Transcript_3500/g.6328 Transcript_3500/m.6328 type:complete len:209 (-) Transcript_3500:46-672(-)